MKLFSKLYNEEEDYDDIKNWAFRLGQIMIEPYSLPGVGTIMVDESGKKYGCGFLYLDNETPVSVLEWVYVNPELSGREKIKTMKAILEVMEGCAEAEEKPLMMSSSTSNGITKLYEKAGWSVVTKNVTHLVKNIQKEGA